MLTPIDIQNHTLKTSMSGYNKKDTEEFLASILDSYETLFRENRTLKEKITSLSEGIQYYKQMENTLQKALILAEKTSAETQEAAKEQADSIIKDIKAEADSTKAEAEASIKESEIKAGQVIREAELKAESVTKEAETRAELIIRDAESKASDIKTQAQNELDGMRISAIRLVQDYEKYCSQVRKLATAQLGLLESDEYKLHVKELSIDDGVTEDKSISSVNTDGALEEQGSIQESSEEVQDDTISEENNDTDGTVDSNTEKEEKFSWNSDKSEYAAAKEPDNANPFTFIDPE